MRELLLILIPLAVAGVTVVMLRQRRLRQAVQDRLWSGIDADGGPEGPVVNSRVRPFARRHYVLPWVAAAITGLILLLLFELPPLFALAFSLLVGLLGGQLDAILLARRFDRMETQLADAIGLMIAAVNVGASLQSALENALRESGRPLRAVLEEVVGRIRYGDDPLEVMRDLRSHVPLETFHLFSTTLAVNWNVGGSLASTLAQVERTVRDRIETSRRIRAMTMQVRVSVAGVLFATYLIAALVWRNSPDRMAGFLTSQIGQLMTAGAMLGQGVGIVWIAYASRPKF